MSESNFEKWAEVNGLPLNKLRNQFYDGYGDDRTKKASEAWQAAERETRERCVQIANEFEEGLRYTPKPEDGYRTGDIVALLRRVADAIRKGDS